MLGLNGDCMNIYLFIVFFSVLTVSCKSSLDVKTASDNAEEEAVEEVVEDVVQEETVASNISLSLLYIG